MIAYKLFHKRKNGTLGSLFINRKAQLPLNVWLKAEEHPTSGFAFRPGWHCTKEPYAPHLSEKGRVWYPVEIKDFTQMQRSASQGGTWFLAKEIKILLQL